MAQRVGFLFLGIAFQNPVGVALMLNSLDFWVALGAGK
jgi:hypothetical protein